MDILDNIPEDKTPNDVRQKYAHLKKILESQHTVIDGNRVPKDKKEVAKTQSEIDAIARKYPNLNF
jgi:hypothetical protein